MSDAGEPVAAGDVVVEAQGEGEGLTAGDKLRQDGMDSFRDFPTVKTEDVQPAPKGPARGTGATERMRLELEEEGAELLDGPMVASGYVPTPKKGNREAANAAKLAVQTQPVRAQPQAGDREWKRRGQPPPKAPKAKHKEECCTVL
eukprot:TRINITY_DN40272_c0_g1_i1.p3 TRINITY_DN40272_c0_g1~~TRINITY_DN40272_c0_g1_i1.p3  ORF type:complete len:146 (+),score=42.51 TRINITY_DN40272_c0_g1_i1:52-489(+)